MNKILVEKLNIFCHHVFGDIFIYIKNLGQRHIEAVQWILDILRTNGSFANLKKYQFYKNKLQFLSYIILS